MPQRRSPKVPSYRLHKQSGQAVVTLVGPDGKRRDVLLGPHGTPESRSEYARVIAEWEAGGRALPAVRAAADLTVNELMVAFWPHVERHHRHPDGSPTSEVQAYLASLAHLRALYGHTPAAKFGALGLKAVRNAMMAEGWCRKVVNQRIGRVKRLFKWAAGEEMVPPAVYHALQAVGGLQKGRTDAQDHEPVEPVADELVNATLPFMTRPVRAMVELQRLTGMRPGEACRLRPCDVDRSAEVWVYRPARHKTQHKGKSRVVVVGPKARAVLAPFLEGRDPEAHCFVPREAVAEMRAESKQARKTKVRPWEKRRAAAKKKRKPKVKPGESYTVAAYGGGIAKACARADRAARQRAEKAKAEAEGREPVKVPRTVPDAERLVPCWHPNQLRHTHATEVRKRFGLEAAQVALGHAQANITEIYAEKNLDLATQVAEEIG